MAHRLPIDRLATHLRCAGYTDAARNLRSAAERGIPFERIDKGRRVRIAAEGDHLCAYLVPAGGGRPALIATDDRLIAVAERPARPPPRPKVSLRLEPRVIRALDKIGALRSPAVGWRVLAAEILTSHLRVVGAIEDAEAAK